MGTKEVSVAIVLPPFHSDVRRRPPVQLMRMGTAVNEIAPTVVIDGQSLNGSIDELADLTASFKPKIVGISMLSPTYNVSVDLAKAIKTRMPNTVFVAGGKHATLETQGTLSSGAFDLIIRGEGDEAMVDITQQYLALGNDRVSLQSSLSGRKGITYPGDKNPETLTRSVDLKALPKINWGILIPSLDSYVGNVASVEDQRGCVHDCSYCSASKSRRRVTLREPTQIADDYVTLYKRGFNSFFLTGDDSFMNPRHSLEMLNNIASTGIDAALSLNTRADSFVRCVNIYGQDFTNALTKAHVSTLHVGVESGDQRILDLCNKQLHVKDVQETIALANKLGITVETNWIVGLPDDSVTSIGNSLSLALQLRDEAGPHFPHVSYFMPYPGTKDTERAKEYGLFDPANLDLSTLTAHDRPLIPTRYLDKERIGELFSSFISTFYSDSYIQSLPTENLRLKAIHMKNKQLNNLDN